MASPSDLLNADLNLATLDGVVTSNAVSVNDRLGQPKLTLDEIQRRSEAAVAAAGFYPVAGSFEAGGTITERNQVLQRTTPPEAFFSWGGAIPPGGLIIPPDSTVAGTGGEGVTAWTNRNDATLAAALSATDSAVPVGGIEAGDLGRRYSETISVADFESLVTGVDWTAAIQAAINTVGVQDPFAANPLGVTINFPSRVVLSVTGTLLIPSYVVLNLNGSTLVGNGTNVMFESAYWADGVLASNFGQPNETRFVVNSQIKNGRISNCNAFKLFNFCESSSVENIRLFGCNQALYALRCFYGSFRKMHSRSPLDGLVTPAFHFDSAMGAVEAAQVFAVGYQRGLLISGNKDNMKLSNFSGEACPTGVSVENSTSGITFERGYFENNTNAISLATTANHENIVVDNCWFFGVTNAIEATSVLSGTWRENNILNGANVSLQNNFSCRMNVEIPTDVSADNAVCAVPANYLLGRANNVKYIKQVYDSVTGFVEAKCNVYVGPIPRNYAGTSGKPIPNQIPFCTHVFTSTSLTIDTKIEFQPFEFVGVSVGVDGVVCGGIALAGVMMTTIPSALTITPSNNAGFYRFVVSGFVSGVAFSGSVKII